MYKRIMGIMTLCVIILPILGTAERQVEKKLTIALVPEENIFTQRARYKPLFEHLSKKLNVEVIMKSLPSYGSLNDEIIAHKIDGAFPGKLVYLLTYVKDNIEPIVKPVWINGMSVDHAWLVVRKDRGIKSVADMKGKTLALVHQLSLAGYLYPRHYLKENGIDHMDAHFKRIIFMGSHDAVIMTVLRGKVDVGFGRSDIYKRLDKENPDLRMAETLTVLHESPPFPTDGFIVRRDLDPTLKRALKSAFLVLDKTDKGRKVLDKLGCMRFIEAGYVDYEPLFQLVEKWGIHLETYCH